MDSIISKIRLYCFFFQAEDGIRAAQESRGLGDVYKRQLVNMGAVAVRLNRTLHFDSDTLEFINDPAANRLLDQPMRGPWKI